MCLLRGVLYVCVNEKQIGFAVDVLNSYLEAVEASVVDILIHARTEVEIDNLIEKLKNDNIALHKEGTAEGYLGVDIQRDGNNIMLKQEGLTKRIIEALGLDSKYSTPIDTPAKSAALGRDVNGKKPAAVSTMPVLLGCFYTLVAADRIYLSQPTNVHVILICLNNLTKMLSNE